MPFFLEGLCFPPNLARIGDDSAPDAEMSGVFYDNTGGEKVELDAARGVAGVGTTVDLEHD